MFLISHDMACFKNLKSALILEKEVQGFPPSGASRTAG